MIKKAHKKPTKKQKALARDKNSMPSEATLFKHVSAIIEKRRHRAGAYANLEITIMYWEIGNYISSILLEGDRGEYGKRIVSELATKLSWSHFTDFHAEGLAGVFPNDAERILAVIEDVNKREEAV